MANVTSLNVNGKKLRVDVDSQTPLLNVLRDHLNLTGTKSVAEKRAAARAQYSSRGK
jgi:aerobic-type carbon monoxide dehydrogenase small subunit (CoxS/CutS family)